MRPDEFFVKHKRQVLLEEFGWDESVYEVQDDLDEDLLTDLRRGPLPHQDDVAVALGLTQLVHEDLERFGTGGGERLDDRQMAEVLRTLRAVLGRLNVEFDLPFRNLSMFRSYWLKRDASGSWQKRRDLLEELFEPLHLRLIRLEESLFEALADPVSPRAGTGWPVVDEEIRELCRRFRSATTPQDYRAVGTHCVGVLEALGRTVYDPGKHLRQGETLPAPDKTKQRLGRYIEDALPGIPNEELRGLANKTIEVAHQVKHRHTPTRREAGIAADAVILPGQHASAT